MPTSAIPNHILIVGSGVFGLGTAYALTQRKGYEHIKITLVDRSDFPAPDAASIDSSRIVRADYADYYYSALCIDALKLWRGEWGADGRYHEPGLAILLDGRNADGGTKAAMQKDMQDNLQRLGLKIGKKEDGGEVTVLDDEAAVKSITPTMPGAGGQSGYVNWTSGWANAEEGMKYLHRKVLETGLVELVTAETKRLIFDKQHDSVLGVELADGKQIEADLTILAAGAWTAKFIDLRGIASASGQVLAYVDLSEEEQKALEGNPTILNASTGMFIIPPRNNVLKVARHGYGYANFETIPHPERVDSGETIEVSLPKTKQDEPDLQIPREGNEACREYLAECLPNLKDRPFTHTRICWYSDTATGDWLLDYHPKYKGLFVATGGSGHAYKFLPVIGDRIVDLLSNQPRDDLGVELQKKWSWPKEKHHSDHVWTDDWRGGRKGMVLDEERKRQQKVESAFLRVS